MTRNPKKPLWGNKWRLCHPGIFCEQLEDRIVLEAMAASVDQTKTQDSHLVSAAPTDSSSPNQPAGLAGEPAQSPDNPSQVFAQDLNVVLVSKALDQIQGISNSVAGDARILTFDPIHDTFATINQSLDSLVATAGHKISTLTIFSHGTEGLLTIGSDNLTVSALNVYASDLAHLSGDLASNAQIQIYGCSVAGDADGRILVNTIATFTGANVFASVDATAGATGNWILEYASNPDATLRPVVDTAKLAESGVSLSQVYPSVENNWGKAMSGAMYYASDDGVHGTELWRSDGTAAGTHMVCDINPGSASSKPSEMTVFDGILYFRASDGNSAHGTELWRSDGTAAGTYMVKDINPGNGNSDPSWFTVVNGVLYFSASDGTTSSSHGAELWHSDGTAAGTAMVKDINPGKQSGGPTFLTDVNGTLFFAASDGSSGNELWRSDGSAAHTVMVKDINAGAKGSDPSLLTYVKETGTLFFSASDGVNGNELWKSDGTDTHTTMVKDINPGKSSSDPRYLTDANGTLFFSASDGNNNHGTELWKSDGTAADTVMVADINANNQSSDPTGLLNVNGVVYFAANDGIHGNELWSSNGTETGTVLVRDVDPGHVGSDPKFLNNYNGAVLFSADDGTHGYQLWRSDGTESGTVLLKQIKQDGSSFPLNFARLNPLFFLADDGTGFKLWKTDGTVTGTVKVTDVTTTGGTGAGGAAIGDISSQPPHREPELAPGAPNQAGEHSEGQGLSSTQDRAAYARLQSDSSYVKSPVQGDRAEGADTYPGSGAARIANHANDHPEKDGIRGGSKDQESASAGNESPFSGQVKVLVLDNGDYSVRNDDFTLVVSHQLWIPPMLKWYLTAVSEGRYRPGSLPREYERMIWDYLQYSSSRQGANQTTIVELEARLAWQWADWRRQVVKDRGNADALPWNYFRGLSEAMILFYGKSRTGKVDYSDAISALHQNIRNLTIIPVQVPDDVGAFSAKDSVAR
jgi:ELWxxDGT repeat protein